MPEHVELYQDEIGEWRWRRVAENGEIVADSGEGYVNRAHALEMAEKLNAGLPIELAERQ